MDIIKSFKERIYKLKDYTIPNLYIWNYFDEIITQVDKSYNEFILEENNADARKAIKVSWLKVINKLNEMRKECLSRVDKLNLDMLDIKIAAIEIEFESLKELVNTQSANLERLQFSINQLNDIIYHEETKIGRFLLKKSARFIKIQSYKNADYIWQKISNTESIQCKIPSELLVLENIYFGNKGFEKLLK